MADCLETVGGRVFLMSQSPSDTGAGAMNTGREELALYGGDKEFHMYQPAKTKGVGGTAATWASAEFYQLLAKDCAVRQVRLLGRRRGSWGRAKRGGRGGIGDHLTTIPPLYATATEENIALNLGVIK